MTILFSFATAESASVVGPGTFSARSKSAWSSRWQKYCVRNNSGRHTISAPTLAAWRTLSQARPRLSSGSGEQDIWIRPTVNESLVGMRDMKIAKIATIAKIGGLKTSCAGDLVTIKNFGNSGDYGNRQSHDRISSASFDSGL